MTIETDRRWEDGERIETFTVYCDSCPESAEFDDVPWDAMIEDLKDDGWVLRKHGSGWIHICPGCAEDEREELASW